MSHDFAPLRAWLKNNDCNQGQLASMLGVSQGHLSAVMKGRRPVTLDIAIKLSVITGLAVERLCSDPEALRFLQLYIIRQKLAA